MTCVPRDSIASCMAHANKILPIVATRLQMRHTQTLMARALAPSNTSKTHHKTSARCWHVMCATRLSCKLHGTREQNLANRCDTFANATYQNADGKGISTL